MKTTKALKCLTEQDPHEWPTVQLVMKKISKDGNDEYQGVHMENAEEVLQSCKSLVVADLKRLDKKLKKRLELSDVKLLRSFLVFLETQSWLASSSDDTLAELREAVDHIISFFRSPLVAKGLCAEVIQDELEEVVEYAQKNLAIDTESYRKVSYKLHTCPDASKWPNVL